MAEVRLTIEEADGELPEVCMCCGEEATETKTKKMSWYPPWVNYLWIAGGPILVVIVSLIMTKRATVQAPFCENHKGHWFNRLLLMWGTTIVIGGIGVLILIAVAVLPKEIQDSVGPFLCIGGIVLFIAWLIVLIGAQATAIRPKEITDDEITLEGVGKEFAEYIKDRDRERRAKRKKVRRQVEEEMEDEDDDEPPPVKKKASSPGIKESKRRVVEDDEEEEKPRPKKKRPPADDDE